MRACPRCGDLSNPLAVVCESCGTALVPVAVGLAELRAVRGGIVKTGPLVHCAYCGRRVRGYCSTHGDLERMERDLVRTPEAVTSEAMPKNRETVSAWKWRGLLITSAKAVR